jgi:hypothetical protein
MACRILPADGNVALSYVLEAFMHAAQCLHVPDQVLFRVVAYRTPQGEWLPFARQLIVGDRTNQAEVVIDVAGRFALISYTGTADDLASTGELETFVTIWQRLLKQPIREVQLQNSVYPHRNPSQSAMGRPHWRFSLSHGGPLVDSSAIPRGPFLLPKRKFFALELGDATALWFADPDASRYSQPIQEIDVVLYDDRAQFSKLDREGNRLRIVAASQTPRPLFCAAVLVDYEGRNIHALTPLTASTAVLDLPSNLRDLQLFLIGDDGFCYDTYREAAAQRQSGRSLLSVSRPAEEGAHDALLAALETGESDRVELKEWIPPERTRTKSFELLKVVCAFANSGGGTLYIGITDSLEIKDVMIPLIKTRVNGGSGDEIRGWYARELQRLVAEGITPAVAADLTWVTHANHHVLRISVRPSKTLTYIVETNECFVRRGANCKRATPVDIAARLSGAVT